MAGGLGSLFVRLGLDAAEFTGGLSKAEAQAIRASKQMQQNFAAVGSAITALGVAAVGAAFGLSKIVENNAKFQDISEIIGDSAVNVASLSQAAAQAGQSFDSITDFSVKLTKALATQDEEGKKAGAGLQAIGLNFEELKNKSPVQQLEDIAKALDGYEDGKEKTAVMQAIVKGGEKLLPFLKDLAEQNERNSKLTKQQIDDSNEYTESLGRLKGQLAVTAGTIAGDVAPAMTSLVGLLSKTIDYFSSGSLATDIFNTALGALKKVFETLLIVGANVAFVFGGVGREIGGIAAQIVALASGDLKGFNAISEAMKADGIKAKAELEKFEKSLLSPTSILAPAKIKKTTIDTRGLAPDKKEDTTKLVKDKESDYANLNKRISETIELQKTEIDLGRKLSSEESFVAKLQADIALSKVALSKPEIDALNEKIKSYQSQAAAIKQVNDAQADQDKQLDSITKTFETLERFDKSRIENAAKKIEALTFENSLVGLNTEQRRVAVYLNELEAAGVLKTSDAYIKSKESITALVAEGKGLNDIQSRIAEISNVGRTVFDNIVTGAEKPFSALGKLIQKEVLNKLYEMTVKPWIVSIATDNGKSGGGGLLTTIFNSLIGSGKADGGAVGANMVYPFLERGTPETVTAGGKTYLFTGSQSGVVNNKVSAAKASTGGGGVVINQTFDNRGADIGIAAKIAETARRTKAETIAAIQDMTRRSPAFLGR